MYRTKCPVFWKGELKRREQNKSAKGNENFWLLTFSLLPVKQKVHHYLISLK